MLFRREVLEGIAGGRIDRVFRVWAVPRVRAGSTQRTWAGLVVIDSVTAVTPEEITEEDAVRAGFADRAALLAALAKSTKVGGYHRVMLHLGGPDPRVELAGDDELTGEELAGIEAELDAIDVRSRRAPWTREVLRLIEEHPGLRALDLAERLGRDKLPFKADVRRLKALGLTESLETGYRLSPRGKALMAYLRRPTRADAHRRLEGRIRVALPPSEAFGLFTPRGEERWVEGWSPHFPVRTDDDTAPGTVFETGHGERTTWVVVERERGRRVSYARVTPGSRAGTVTVTLEDDGDGHSLVRVVYDLTALTTQAAGELERFADEYPAFLASWQEAIARLTEG